MKKLLPTIGLYLGTFVVLNVAMFFLLKLTQPVPSPSELAMGQDSTAHDSAHVALHDTSAVAEHANTEQSTASGTLTDTTHAGVDAMHGEQPAASVTHEQATVTEQTSQLTNVADSTRAENAGAVDSLASGDVPAIEEPEVATETEKSDLEIAKLAKVLEGMKPAEAAVIAERLPTDTIVQLVMRMKARTGAKMMASLPVQVAASVAERMAELSGAKKS